jgi:hypothetical protein
MSSSSCSGEDISLRSRNEGRKRRGTHLFSLRTTGSCLRILKGSEKPMLSSSERKEEKREQQPESKE